MFGIQVAMKSTLCVSCDAWGDAQCVCPDGATLEQVDPETLPARLRRDWRRLARKHGTNAVLVKLANEEEFFLVHRRILG